MTHNYHNRAFPIFTARVRSTREGNVLTSVCPSIHPSVCPQGGVPISHNALQHFPECHEAAAGGGYPDPPRGGTRSGTPPGGVTRVRYPPRGLPGSGTPPGGYPVRYPPGGLPGSGTPRGGTRVRYPPGGTRVRYPPWGGTRLRYLGGGTRVRYPPGGTRVRYPPGGVPGSGTPPGGGTQLRYPPPGGGTRVGQQKEYSLHGGRYASCVHAGGLSCLF